MFSLKRNPKCVSWVVIRCFVLSLCMTYWSIFTNNLFIQSGLSIETPDYEHTPSCIPVHEWNELVKVRYSAQSHCIVSSVLISPGPVFLSVKNSWGVPGRTRGRSREHPFHVFPKRRWVPKSQAGKKNQRAKRIRIKVSEVKKKATRLRKWITTILILYACGSCDLFSVWTEWWYSTEEIK